MAKNLLCESNFRLLWPKIINLGKKYWLESSNFDLEWDGHARARNYPGISRAYQCRKLSLPVYYIPGMPVPVRCPKFYALLSSIFSHYGRKYVYEIDRYTNRVQHFKKAHRIYKIDWHWSALPTFKIRHFEKLKKKDNSLIKSISQKPFFYVFRNGL